MLRFGVVCKISKKLQNFAQLLELKFFWSVIFTRQFRHVEKSGKGIAFQNEPISDVSWHALVPIFCVNP